MEALIATAFVCLAIGIAAGFAWADLRRNETHESFWRDNSWAVEFLLRQDDGSVTNYRRMMYEAPMWAKQPERRNSSQTDSKNLIQ